MKKYLDFEGGIEKIENQISELDTSRNDFKNTHYKLENKKDILLRKLYSNLTPWEKVQVARHADRPHAIDYIKLIFNDIVYLHGDKKFSDDKAILGCLAKLDEYSVMVIGTEKGNSMESRIQHNFGMAKPEGYRKAQRLMKLAEKFNLPIITFVDTAGAFPGKEAEERGQSESIASSIALSLKIKTIMISVIIGEGGSGGAIALATSDKILMLENSIYSVISPEGCASILWRSTDFTQKAAETLRLTAEDCLKLEIIDEKISEIPGGAHRYPNEQALLVREKILKNLNELKNTDIETLILNRNRKYLDITSNI